MGCPPLSLWLRQWPWGDAHAWSTSIFADLVSNQSAEGLLEDCDLFGPARDDVLAMAVKMANVLDEPGQDLEADFPKSKKQQKKQCWGLWGMLVQWPLQRQEGQPVSPTPCALPGLLAFRHSLFPFVVQGGAAGQVYGAASH